MKHYSEDMILEKYRETSMMLTYWEDLSKKTLGVSVGVILMNTRDHPKFKNHTYGELNTAMPVSNNKDKKVFLAVLADDIDKTTSIIISHEIGHWVLKIQGYQGVDGSNRENRNLASLLNSLAHHLPLYKLQTNLGYSIQLEIDDRTRHNIDLFAKDSEKLDNHCEFINALYLADDVMSCSEDLKGELKKVLLEKHPKTLSLINQIIETKNFYDIYKPGKNIKFIKMVIKKLKLPGDFFPKDDIVTLRKLIHDTQQ